MNSVMNARSARIGGRKLASRRLSWHRGQRGLPRHRGQVSPGAASATSPKHEPVGAEGGCAASSMTLAVRARWVFHSPDIGIACPPFEDRHLARVADRGILLADA